MARDEGLEELVRDDLQAVSGLSEKRMFGGLAWLMHGNLLCGARSDGLLVRLGKGNDAWALELPDISPMTVGNRRMTGWIRAGVGAFGKDDIRRNLLDAAIDFVHSLPPK